MAYPNIGISHDSKRAAHSGLKVETADDGSVRARRLYTSTLYEFTLVHAFITATDKNSILAHYAANYATSFTYTWQADGVAYTCNYVDEPEVQTVPGGNLWTVVTKLVGR